MELFDHTFLDKKQSLRRAETLNEVLSEIDDLAGAIPLFSLPLKAGIGTLNRTFSRIIKKAKENTTLSLDATQTNPTRRAQATKLIHAMLKKNEFQPTVLVVDNFHMVDKASACLLLGMAGAFGQLPFILVGTYRPDELERRSELRDLVKRDFPAVQLDKGMEVETIELQYLNEEDITEFVQYRYPNIQRINKRTLAVLHNKTGGNPLILGETMTYLEGRGVLDDEMQMVDTLDEISFDKKSKVPHVIGLRIDHLRDDSEKDYTMHTRVSIAGESFTADLAGELVGDDALTLCERLEQAAERYRFIHEQESSESYRFYHGIIHEAFYDRATKNQKVAKELHLRAALALEKEAHSDPKSYQPGRIAGHFIYALAPARAIPHLKAAAEAATQAQAYHELAELNGLLLSAMEESGTGTDRERFDVLINLGRANEFLGKKQDAVDTLSKAVALAEEMDEKLLLASSLTHLSISLFHTGHHNESSEAANRALNIYKPTSEDLSGDDLHTYGICLDWVAENHRSNYEMEIALEFHEKARIVGQKCGSRRLEAHANANIGAVHMWRKEYEKVLPLWREALRISKFPGKEDWPWVSHYTIDVGLILFLLRDYDDAMAMIGDGLDLAKSNYFYDNVARGRMNKASVSFAQALESEEEAKREVLLSESEKLYQQALRVAKAHNIARLVWRIQHNLGNIDKIRSNSDGAEKWYRQSADFLEQVRQGELDVKGFMKHRYRPYRSLMMIAWKLRRNREEIRTLADRSCHQETIEYAERLMSGQLDMLREASDDRNIFSGYYIETE